MKGIGYLKHAVELHPEYVNGYFVVGLAWYKLGNDKKTVLYWKLELFVSTNPYLSNYYTVYCNQLQSKGMEAFNREDYKKSIYYYNLWAIVKPNDYDPWYNLGAAYLNAGSKLKAKECWKKRE